MRYIRIIACVLFSLLFITACRDNTPEPDVFDIETARIGIMTGTTGEMFAVEAYPGASIYNFGNIMDAVAALHSSQVDAVITADVFCRNIARENPSFERIPELLTREHISAGIKKGNDELLEDINSIIAVLSEDGTLDELAYRWIESYPPVPVEIPAVTTGDPLKVGTAVSSMPFSFLDANGNPTGFAPELAKRIGLMLERPIEFIIVEFGALIPALESGKIDVIIDIMAATEERRQSINFSDPYYISGQNILKRRETGSALRNEDFIGKRIAFAYAEGIEELFAEHVGDFIPIYCTYEHEAMEFLKSGKADAMLMDEPMARKWVLIHPEMSIIYPAFAEHGFGAIFNMDKPQLHAAFNDFLKEIKSDGIHEDMIDRWINTADSPPMPEILSENNNGVLTFATYVELEPFGHVANGEVTGFDVELARRFAAYMNMELNVVTMDWDALLPYVNSGRADFAASLFVITDERSDAVMFSDPYYYGGAVLVVKVAGEQASQSDFWQDLVTAFQRNLLHENRWMMVVDGLRVSLIITLLAFILATVLGFGVCGLRMSTNPVLKALGSLYVTVLRGTPIVVLLMITFYVIFAGSSISSVTVAVIAFGVNGAAFIGEIIRSAIMTVDKGQIEAARSMGFSGAGAFFTVTFPQAVRVAFPVYMSEFVSMFKMTSVVGYIAIVDLTKAGDIIRSRTYDAFFPLIMVALIYLVAASLMILLMNFINNKTNKRLRRAAR